MARSAEDSSRKRWQESLAPDQVIVIVSSIRLFWLFGNFSVCFQELCFIANFFLSVQAVS